MKKTIKTRIAAAALALVMITSLSATAFADGPQGGPEGGPQQGGMQMGGSAPMGGLQQGGFSQDQQMNSPQGFQQDWQRGDLQHGSFRQDRHMGNPQQGDFDQDRHMGAPRQGGFSQDQQPPENPEGSEPPADDRQSPEKPEGRAEKTPPEKPEGENQTLPQDEQGMFRLFQQFLEWLKDYSAA